jgi:transposase
VIDSAPDNMQSLPESVEALRALILATFAERDAVVTERDILLTQNDRLRHLLLKLTRMHFGTKSERLPEEQLQLGLEALEQAITSSGIPPAARAEPWPASPKMTRRRRSRILICARTMRPNGVPAVARCRHICRGSR